MIEQGLGWHAWVTLAAVTLALVALARDLASPAASLLAALVVLMVTGAVKPEAGLAGFSNPAMLAVGALYVVAAAVRKTGALSFLGWIMRPRSKRIDAALCRTMIPAATVSGFLNNTPIVAFLTPMVQRWSQRAGISPSKLLIPLSYATILGGIGTLIGTSTNLVVSNLLRQDSGTGLGMFELMWVAVPATATGVAWFLLFGHRLLPDGDTAIAAGRTGNGRSYQFDLRVPGASPLVGQSIERAGLRHLEDAFLAHIRRRGELIGPVSPTLTLEARDTLTFFGDSRRLDRLLVDGGLARVIGLRDEQGAEALPLYEAVVSPESTLVGRSLKDSDFRDRFQAVVLGIHRAGRRLTGPVGKSPIEAGDLLLIEAGPRFEERWGQSREFYLVAPLEREAPPASGKAPWVLLILGAMMASVALGWLPMVTASFAAAMAVVLVRAVAAHEARRAVDMTVLVVIAAAFGIGEAIHESGLAAFFASRLLLLASGLGVVGALALVYLCTNLLTELLTNSVAAVLVFPVGMVVAANLGIEPRAVAVVVAVAASAGFATPIGYQTNLMVMGPGGYRFRDYVRVGLPLNVLIMIVTLLVVPRIWL